MGKHDDFIKISYCIFKIHEPFIKLLVAAVYRGTPKIYLYTGKDITSGLSDNVNILRQHLPIGKYVTISPYNNKSSLLA